MLVQACTSKERRALNQIWAAAEDYNFQPAFMAFRSNRSPDFYMNCIIGLVHKWYGESMTSSLFATWEHDLRRAMFDDLAWLALENAVYERELPFRPVLEQLRRDYAEAFFQQEALLSRQEWMAKNPLVYALQSARWHRVLGERSLTVSPRVRTLDTLLSCSGSLSSEELAHAIRSAILQYFRPNDKGRERGVISISIQNRLFSFLTQFLPAKTARADSLSIGRTASSADGTSCSPPRQKKIRQQQSGTAAGDRAWIEACFGRSYLTPDQLAAAELSLCTGNHFGCHLWITDGSPSSGRPPGREERQILEQANAQYAKNKEAYYRDSDLHQNAVLRLTAQIQNCLLIHMQPQPEPSRLGRLNGSLVWRQALLGDSRVFTRFSEENQVGFTVDLLLDGSASRLRFQESIAAQGCILAESLQRCGIPVRVLSFCSLRGYTVLRILKDYGKQNEIQQIFHYFSAGWNRDGLALRTAGELLKSAPEGRHLLILLTDAGPNDSHKIPPTGRIPFYRNYDGSAGIDDTASEVRALQKSHIHVSAIFMGSSANIPAAGKIFGSNYVRIHRMDQLAAAAGELIRSQILEAGQ